MPTFNGLSLAAREALLGRGCSSSATISSRRAATTARARSKRTTPAFAWNLDADRGYARYDQRHRSAFSAGYELPFGPGKPLPLGRRRDGAHARRLAGAEHRAVRERLPVHGHVHQRLPVRIVHSAARQHGARREQRSAGQPGVRPKWFDVTAVRGAGRSARRAPPAATPFAARHPARRPLVHQAHPARPRPAGAQGRDLQPVQPRRTSGARTRTSRTLTAGVISVADDGRATRSSASRVLW